MYRQNTFKLNSFIGSMRFSFTTNGINNKEDYLGGLQRAFGSHLISNNIDTAVFTQGNPGIGLQLGINTDGTSGGKDNSAKAIKSVSTPIFTCNIPFRPKTINVVGEANQVSGYLSGWGLVFTGNISNVRRTVIFQADASQAVDTSGFCCIDDTNAVLLVEQPATARMAINVSIDVEKDLTLCFKDNRDTSYTMEYINMLYTKHTETIANTPFYLQKLEIFE